MDECKDNTKKSSTTKVGGHIPHQAFQCLEYYHLKI